SVTGVTDFVTDGIGTYPVGATLTGSLTKNAVSGVASFTDLSINPAANGYTLAASSTGLTAANSSAFNATSVGIISGTVVRVSDGTPVSEALVEALQFGLPHGSAITGTDGTFSVK